MEEFIIGLACVVAILFTAGRLISSESHGTIESGKQFITSNATYICKKTNELIDEQGD